MSSPGWTQAIYEQSVNISETEAADMLGIGLTTLDKLRKTGKIGYYQAVPGGKVQFTSEQLESYLKRVERQELVVISFY